jgi:hypothetical protein
LADGTEEIIQKERMLIGDGWMATDMTKVTQVTVATDPSSGQKTATIKWKVYRSDDTDKDQTRDSMVKDEGFIRFEPTPDGLGTRITFQNATKTQTRLQKAPGLSWVPGIRDNLTAWTTASYGRKVVLRYRDIAQQRIAPAVFDRE